MKLIDRDKLLEQIKEWWSGAKQDADFYAAYIYDDIIQYVEHMRYYDTSSQQK